MRPFLIILVLSAGTLTACLKRANVPCEQDSNCDLSAGGVCTAAPTGNRWCAYPNPDCASGLSYSTQAVGDGVSGSCVATKDDGGAHSCKVRIVFQEGCAFQPGCSAEIWVANPDGSGLANLSNNSTADDTEPSWSPDGLKVAFASNRFSDQSANDYDIFAINADGTGFVDLTPNKTTQDSSPVWSPDGTRIAFVRDQYVWVMKANGTGAAPVSAMSTIVWISGLAWSPDGNKIVFAGYDSHVLSEAHLYVVAVGDGSSPVRLTSSTAKEGEVSWAPAPKIVWSSQGDIFVANGDDTGLLNVTKSSADNNSSPQISDDGQTIIFSSAAGGYTQAWSVASSGGTVAPLTHNMLTNDGGRIGDLPTDISSDGLLVAYEHSTSDTASSIGVIDITGKTAHVFNAPGGVNSRSAKFSTCPNPSATLASRDIHSVISR